MMKSIEKLQMKMTLKMLEQSSMRKKQKGLTTVEYAVAGSLIALAVVVAFSELGNAVGNAINTITNVID